MHCGSESLKINGTGFIGQMSFTANGVEAPKENFYYRVQVIKQQIKHTFSFCMSLSQRVCFVCRLLRRGQRHAWRPCVVLASMWTSGWVKTWWMTMMMLLLTVAQVADCRPPRPHTATCQAEWVWIHCRSLIDVFIPPLGILWAMTVLCFLLFRLSVHIHVHACVCICVWVETFPISLSLICSFYCLALCIVHILCILLHDECSTVQWTND